MLFLLSSDVERNVNKTFPQCLQMTFQDKYDIMIKFLVRDMTK